MTAPETVWTRARTRQPATLGRQQVSITRVSLIELKCTLQRIECADAIPAGEQRFAKTCPGTTEPGVLLYKQLPNSDGVKKSPLFTQVARNISQLLRSELEVIESIPLQLSVLRDRGVYTLSGECLNEHLADRLAVFVRFNHCQSGVMAVV
jgi:hypothetical protein